MAWLWTVWELLAEPWTWGSWFWRGALSASLSALCCALIGVHLYLRRMSLLSDALAHVALPGIVLAWLIGGRLDAFTLFLGAAAMGALSAVLIEWLAKHPRVRPDASIGIVFTALFSLGILLLSSVVRDAHIDLHCLLFGDLLGVSDRSMLLLGLALPLTLLGLFVGRRALLAGSFDPGTALALGMPLAFAHYALTTGTAVVAVASFEAVGAILVIALLIVPAATAHQLASSMRGMMGWAVAVALVSSWLGLFLSVWWNLSPSGMIVLVQGGCWVLSLLAGRRQRAGHALGRGQGASGRRATG